MSEFQFKAVFTFTHQIIRLASFNILILNSIRNETPQLATNLNHEKNDEKNNMVMRKPFCFLFHITQRSDANKRKERLMKLTYHI